VSRVLLENGEHIDCDYVVNAAGMWARQLAAKSGVSLPNQACEHYYLITDPIPEVPHIATKKQKKICVIHRFFFFLIRLTKTCRFWKIPRTLRTFVRKEEG
jgi:glycine/D-amino acid oxidase-like deaminating enzyme